MIINKLEIKNFGKFHEKQVKFGAGINVVYGENESGKSTLHKFIHSVLFGMERTNEKDIYNQCEPWENPTCYAGDMEFTCGGKRFLLSRNFYKETENVRLVNLDDGEQLSVENRDLQMLLGGISEGIFDNTVSVGQLKCVTGHSLAEELKNYIVNYDGGGDEDVRPARAITNLKAKRNQLQEQKKQEQTQVELKLRELQAKTELLQLQQEACQKKIEEKKAGEKINPVKHSAEKISLKKSSLKKPARSAGSIQRIWNKIAITWTAAAFLALVMGFVFWGDVKSVIFFVLSCTAGVQVPVSFLIQRHLIGKVRNVSDNQVHTKGTQNAESEGNWQQMQEDWQERQVMLENLLQEQEELNEMRYERSQMDEEIEAVDYAIGMLEKTIGNMQEGIRERIRLRTGEILGELTDGKYSNILIEPNMNICVQTIQKSIELHQLSRGMLEQVYFALRMALSEVLCVQEPLPVILDDVFSMYDEKYLEKTLKWLAEHKEQVIILTCHKREGEILDRMGVLYKKINL